MKIKSANDQLETDNRTVKREHQNYKQQRIKQVML